MNQIYPIPSLPTGNTSPNFWMQKPAQISGCPPGLQYLTQVDCMFIEQEVCLVEAFTGKNTNNRYFIKNSEGNQIYLASEETEICMRNCCGNKRGFQIYLLDHSNQQVIKISREFKFFAQSSIFAGFCDLCAHELTVEAPVGTVVGYVKQRGSFRSAHYDILNENHEPVLKIRGPFCIYDGPFCPCDNEFQILSVNDGNQIGKLSKEYAGFAKEKFTNADNFSIRFPSDLSVKTKATLIGCLFLIDFMYFEKNQHKKKSKKNNSAFN